MASQTPREELLELVRAWVHMDGRAQLSLTRPKGHMIRALYALLDTSHTDEHGQREALSILSRGAAEREGE